MTPVVIWDWAIAGCAMAAQSTGTSHNRRNIG
jgi:hypothetical protein